MTAISVTTDSPLPNYKSHHKYCMILKKPEIEGIHL